MANKVFIVKKGGKITLLLAKPKSSTAASIVPFKSKGIVKQRRDADYLPRRIKKGSGINFYDLAQLKNLTTGNFEDVEVFLDYGTGASEALEILNSCLEISQSEWKNRFKKIEYSQAEKYRFGVYINNESEPEIISSSNANFTGAGLKANTPSITRFRVEGFQSGDDSFVFYESNVCGGLFPAIDTVFQKVTALPTASAEQVELNLNGNQPINVFLNQAVFTLHGFSNVADEGTGTFTSFVQDFDIDTLWFQPANTTLPSSTSRQLCSEFKLESFIGGESRTLDFRNSYYDGETNKILSWARSKILSAYEESENYGQAVQAAVDRLLADFGAKAYLADLPFHLSATVFNHVHTVESEVVFPQLFWYSGTPPDYQYPLDEGDFPGNFDSIVDPPVQPTISELDEFIIDENTVVNIEQGGSYPDTLLAAFEQNGQFFYVWARDAEI